MREKHSGSYRNLLSFHEVPHVSVIVNASGVESGACHEATSAGNEDNSDHFGEISGCDAPYEALYHRHAPD
jgi:hypothetical protein